MSYWTVPTSKLITRQKPSTVRFRSFQIAYVCHSWSLNCLFCRRRRSPQHSGDHNFWLLPQLRSLRRSRPCSVPHHRNAHLDSAPRRNQPLHGLSIHKRPSTLATRFLPLLRNNVSPTEITEFFQNYCISFILTFSGMVVSSNRVVRGFLRPRKSHSMSWRKRATSCPGQASKTEVEDQHHDSKAIAVLCKTYLNTLTYPMSEMHTR